MRLPSTMPRKLAQQAAAASRNPTKISQRMLCFPRADDKAKRLSLYTGFFHRETGLRQAAAARRTFLSECCAFAGALAWSKHYFIRAREEELRESWCLLGLFSRAPCSHPEFTLPGRNKQTQPQPCSSMRKLGWHPIHTTISRCRHRLAFYSGAQEDSRTRPVLSPQKRRRDRIPAHGPCTGMGNCGGQSPLLPWHIPCHPHRCHILVEDGI